VARGIDDPDFDLAATLTSAGATPLESTFPGINMIRLPSYYTSSSDTVAGYQQYVTWLTANHIVVEIEDHDYPNVLTGTALTGAVQWYSTMAAAFMNNPYVWFGTQNEPNNPSDQSVVTDMQVAIYNAIRGTGNSNPIMIVPIGGYTTNGLTASAYTSMTNVLWDVHYYNWIANYSTDQATNDSALASEISGVAAFSPSADGTMPVIVGEYGNSTDGNSIDAGWTETVTAVTSSGYGALAWAWYYPGATGDQLTDGSGNLTAYGQMVAQFIMQ
jgi:hypothetical protein